jgi:hypothetical protein
MGAGPSGSPVTLNRPRALRKCDTTWPAAALRLDIVKYPYRCVSGSNLAIPCVGVT